MTRDAEHLFTGLSAIGVSSLQKWYSGPLPVFN